MTRGVGAGLPLYSVLLLLRSGVHYFIRTWIDDVSPLNFINCQVNVVSALPPQTSIWSWAQMTFEVYTTRHYRFTRYVFKLTFPLIKCSNGRTLLLYFTTMQLCR